MSTGSPTFNRTILELKGLKDKNGMEIYNAFNRTILELKCISLALNPVPNSTFNRTILELKLDGFDAIDNPYAAFNRTILELKCVSGILSIGYQFLQSHHTGIEMTWIERKDFDELTPSIAPYWNGNKRKKLKKRHLIPFNRTILELKLGMGLGKTASVLPFNRTILELKFDVGTPFVQ